MKYFVLKHQIIGSCFYEFYKGKWDDHTFWSDDSIYLDDNVMSDGFVETIIEVVPAYDPFGETEITTTEWQEIGNRILQRDIESQEQYGECNVWAQSVFENHECFTILGV